MNIKNILVGTAVSAVMFGAMAIPALATSPSTTDLSARNWIVYNRSDTAPTWDNYEATVLGTGGVGFTFNQASKGWYTAYLKAYYNGDLTGKTITAKVSVAQTGATFASRTGGTPTVGLVIKSKVGNWGVNDYWWYTPRLNLSALNTLNTVISAPTSSDRASWTNIDGQSATDPTVYTGASSVPGLMYTAESPYDGFTKALKHVKEVGLSFGGDGYASGVALTGGTASFQLNSFTVTPTVVTPAP